MPFSLQVGDLERLLAEEDAERGREQLRAVGGIEGLAAKLGVKLTEGVRSEELQERRQAFGVNLIPEKPPRSYLSYVWDALSDFTLRLLSGCAVLSITIAVAFERDVELSWLEGVAILGTVLAVCNIQAVQDWAKERSFRRLNADVNRQTIPVLRDARVCEILKFDIVVGDVINIGVGDILEADGVLIHGEDVQVDESALTGEPEDIKKNAEVPFLYSGTAVKSGSGVYLATAVGINSKSGKITALVRGQKLARAALPAEVGQVGDIESDGVAGELAKEKEHGHDEVEKQEEGEEEEESSVLRQKLDVMVGRIAYFAFSSAGIATSVMLIRYVVENHIQHHMGWEWGRDPVLILHAFIGGIAIVVVAIPEGLPLAVTLALSLSMRKMQKDNNLVKHLDATETMGSATTICSDKTGTLTQNRMTVVRAFIGGHEFSGENAVERSCGKKAYQSGMIPQSLATAVCENICSTKAQGAEIEWDPAKNAWEQRGNKTDCALLAFARDFGVDYNELQTRPQYHIPQGDGRSIFGLKMFPFSSSRKRAAMALPLTANPKGPCRIYVKGASEIVLKLCSEEMQLDGTTVPLSEQRRDAIFEDVVEKFAGEAMRTIGLAYADFDEVPDWEAEISEEESLRLTGLKATTFEAETELIFLGVAGIHDPLRESVPAAVAKCNEAGVDVRMVTGDHKATAIAIAKECGILRKGIDYAASGKLIHEHTAMTGDEFRRMVLVKGEIDQDAFDEIWPFLRVLARSSPEDKHTLVTGIMASNLYMSEKGRELGLFPDRQIVAVTGDGTNDAPALRKANIGFAMKIAGTRVAQDAADILLLDDNFESVVKACMWGRNVYDSIVKFLQFQLTVNVGAVVISVVGAVFVEHMPLSVVQMLWVNLIMDSLGALALAAEPPTESLLQRKPYGRNRALLSFEMLVTMGGQVCLQLAVLLSFLFAGAGPAPPSGLTEDELHTWQWQPGGFLGIESGINRDPRDPPSVHYTMIFNVFVFLQMFNWINCRKLHWEWNVLSGIERNPVFVAIWFTCVGVQVILVQIAAIGGGAGENKAFKTVALSGSQWAICAGFGAISLPWYVVLVAVGRFILQARTSSSAGGPTGQLHDGTPPPAVVGVLDAVPRASVRQQMNRTVSNYGPAAPADMVQVITRSGSMASTASVLESRRSRIDKQNYTGYSRGSQSGAAARASTRQTIRMTVALGEDYDVTTARYEPPALINDPPANQAVSEGARPKAKTRPKAKAAKKKESDLADAEDAGQKKKKEKKASVEPGAAAKRKAKKAGDAPDEADRPRRQDD